nr:hypothetical protein [Escherichia coli]
MLNQETAKAARTDSGYILRAPRRMRVADAVAQYMRVHTHILSVLVLIRTPLRLVHMDIPSPLTLLVTRKTPSKTSHLTIL